MRTDSEIKRDVESELKWDPELDATDIAVSVKGGVVALSGYARSYADKYFAERVAKRVAGVHGVADDIEVRLPSSDTMPDPEIARGAVAAIRGPASLRRGQDSGDRERGLVDPRRRCGVELRARSGGSGGTPPEGRQSGGQSDPYQAKSPCPPKSSGRSRRRSVATPRSMPNTLPWRQATASSC